MVIDPLRVFTIAQTAERLGVSQVTIRRLIHSDLLPSVAVGHRRMVSATALSQYIERHTNGPDEAA